MNDEDVKTAGVALAFALGGLVLGAVLGAAGREALDESDEEALALSRARQLHEAGAAAYQHGYRAGYDVARREAGRREDRAVEQAHWDGAALGYRNGREYERGVAAKRSGARTIVRGSGG